MSTVRSKSRHSSPFFHGHPNQKKAELEIPPGIEGAWLIAGLHFPTGRRILFLSAAKDGDEAVKEATARMSDLDPFASPQDWGYSVEFYDVDSVYAMQHDQADAREAELMASMEDTQVLDVTDPGYLLDSDLELLEDPGLGDEFPPISPVDVPVAYGLGRKFRKDRPFDPAEVDYHLQDAREMVQA